MSEVSERSNDREDALRRAVLAMRQMRGRMEAFEAERAGPIAVVGMGCRYPGGVNSPEDYWRLIEQGRDAIGDIPGDRWDKEMFYDPDPDAPGRMYTKRGGFVAEPGRRFDASFFGISPREAVATDPQHRLLLEVSWEALERAGQSPDDLAGSRTGVFIGISTSDYGELRCGTGDRDVIDPYWGLGNSPSFAAGRLAYTLGLQGPVVPVDTACSSSLVATHLAMQALRRQECDMALAGGVNLILSPSLMIYFCKLRALSANGRCRTFDAGADGYVRGEGCGMLVLKRLPDALASGDNILGVLRGSAVAHNGRSGGITIPNGPSQQAVIRRALEESGYPPAAVGYVEAHGTGTPLGDPIEMQALAATYGKAPRPANPLVVGSVKTQIGHLEAAAGIAGLSRALLALQQGKMPAHLHLDEINPHIATAVDQRFDYRMAVAGETWDATDQPRVAAVSSFGINGTNAHLVLEEAPRRPSPPSAPVRTELLVLSAKHADALGALARSYATQLRDAPGLPLADVCHTAAVGRAHFRERLAVCGDNPADLASKLERWLDGRNQDDVLSGIQPAGQVPPLAMVFPARAEGLERMETALSARFAAFRTAIEACHDAPRLFALQYALFMLWKDWKLSPQSVAGEGVGRAAAAFAAGALSFEDAVALARALDQDTPVPATLSWQRPKVNWLEPGTGEPIASGRDVDWRAQADPRPRRLPQDAVVLDISGHHAPSADHMVASTLARLYVAGLTPDWRAGDRAGERRIVVLPTYPFQRQEYWEAAMPTVNGTASVPGSDEAISMLQPAWRAAALGAPLRKIDIADVLVGDPAQIEAATTAFAAQGIAIRPLVDAGIAPDGKALVRLADAAAPEPLMALIRHPLVDLRFIASTDTDVMVPARALLPVLQALPQNGGGYWLATRQAFATTDAEAASPAAAALWGMLLSLREERPACEVGVIDIDVPNLSVLAAEVAAGCATGTPVAWRGGQRMQRVTESRASTVSVPVLRADASYLVTGGLGGIGQQLIRWLAAHGARHITVPSRRGAGDERVRALGDLAGEGVAIRVVDGNLTGRDAMAALISEMATSEHPLAGVFHAAGVSRDALIMDQSAQALSEVMAPKATAAQILHELTLSLPLDHFVLFSSIAGAMGSAGQSTYAAANAALAALASTRRAAGLPALCIDWGLWEGDGMGAALSAQDRARLLRRGLRPMPPDRAFECLGTAMCSNAPHWIIGLLVDTRQRGDTPEAGWKSRIEAAQGAERGRLIAECLSACVGQVLDMPAGQVKAEGHLFELGFDSLMVMDLVKLLKKQLGCVLYPRELYQTPRVGDLADYLAKALAGDAGAEASPASAAASASPAPPAPAWTRASPIAEVVTEPVPDIGFILSAPRSGSTLLRVMLAGHPGLFVPPELHLLQFATMADRAESLAGSHLDEGLLRAWMELRACSGDDARASIDALVAAGTPIQDIYRLLHQEAGQRRVIDKSPSYATDLDTLLRAERICRAPRYVHLVRHPLAMIGSFVRMRMDRLIGAEGVDPAALAEDIWLNMNRNVLALAERAGADRCLQIRYEDLVREPEAHGRRLCDFLGVEFDPAVLDPYGDVRMTDGISERSLSVGDPNFNEHQAIDSALAEGWRREDLTHQLSAETIELAHTLGYELPASHRSVQRAAPGRMRESHVRGQGIDLTVCHWGDPQAPAVLCLHGILEQGGVFGPMAAPLVAAGYQVIAPDLRGHGKSEHTGPASGYQLTDFVADLSALVEQLELPPVTLLGVSMGAAVAALFAAARPDAVEGLVLVEPPAPRRTDTEAALSMLRAQLAGASGSTVRRVMPDLEAAIQRLMEAVPSLDPDQARRLAERGTEHRDDGVHWRWDPRLRSPTGIGTMPGLDDLLGHIRVPYTLVFGRNGDLVQARDWRAACNRHLREIVELPGGHYLHFDAPDALSQIVRQVRSSTTEPVLETE